MDGRATPIRARSRTNLRLRSRTVSDLGGADTDLAPLWQQQLLRLRQQRRQQQQQEQQQREQQREANEKAKRELLASWRDASRSLAQMHLDSSKLLVTVSHAVTAPIVLLSVGSGIANLATGVKGALPAGPERCAAENTAMHLVSGALALGVAALTALQNLLGARERAERHRMCGDEFEKLARHIEVSVLLTNTEGTTYASLSEYIKDCNVRFDQLLERAPTLPESIHRRHCERIPGGAAGALLLRRAATLRDPRELQRELQRELGALVAAELARRPAAGPPPPRPAPARRSSICMPCAAPAAARGSADFPRSSSCDNL